MKNFSDKSCRGEYLKFIGFNWESEQLQLLQELCDIVLILFNQPWRSLKNNK